MLRPLVDQHVGVDLAEQPEVALVAVGASDSVEDEGVRITRNYRVTPEFILLVVSFIDSRTQSKYLRIRDRVIEHYLSTGSELCFAVPRFHEVWVNIFQAGIQVAAVYKKKCFDQLSFRAVSFDSSYKCTLSVVGQTSHGRKNSAADRSELHCVHVMVADGVPVACKPGFSEGVPELARFMRSNTCLSQRSQTEIVLFDSPEKWGLQDVQKLFPNVKCVGGDPLHAWMHLAKFVKEGDQLCRDIKKVMLKFNGKPAPTLKTKRYFDVGQRRGQHQGNFEARPFELRKAYDRIQTSTYQKKAH